MATCTLPDNSATFLIQWCSIRSLIGGGGGVAFGLGGFVFEMVAKFGKVIIVPLMAVGVNNLVLLL